jgi:hypothetical protein
LAAPLLGAALALACACGQTVPHGGVPATPEASASAAAGPIRPGRRVPSDVMPADLDLVVRLDLARARASLGAEPMRQLSERALGTSDPEPEVRHALEHADVVWLGLRVADVLDGDRVMVTEAKDKPPKLDPTQWKPAEAGIERVVVYDAARPVGRDGTARIVDLGDGTMGFVSPVEADSVNRTLRNGPDPERGQPEARGLLSLDWRVGRPGVALVNRHPSLASLMTGVRRASAVLDTRGRELELEGRLQCRDAASAGRVARFLRTIAEAGRELPRFAKLVSSFELQESGSMVRIHWVAPPELVVELVREPAPPAAPARSAAPSASPSVAPSAAAPLH